MDNKCKEMTYDECIADGWEMTADGFWFKETSEQSGTRSVDNIIGFCSIWEKNINP